MSKNSSAPCLVMLALQVLYQTSSVSKTRPLQDAGMKNEVIYGSVPISTVTSIADVGNSTLKCLR